MILRFSGFSRLYPENPLIQRILILTMDRLFRCKSPYHSRIESANS